MSHINEWCLKMIIQFRPTAKLEKLLSHLVAACLFLHAVSCKTAEVQPQKETEEKIISYSVEKGEWNNSDLTAIRRKPGFINMEYSSGRKYRHHRFDLWDINGDNRADMVDVLDLNGRVIQRIYDYNFDGIPDKVDKVEI